MSNITDSSTKPKVYVRTLCNTESHVEMSGVDSSGVWHPYTELDTVEILDISIDTSTKVRPPTSLQVDFNQLDLILGNDPYKEMYDLIKQASTNFWHKN